ncbi:MAG: hypothetical protein IT379_41950 [Deltaproteobacteria bacterium]|nr:hypothetical protein [Deltaproteobacteria bacterium]
MTEWPLPYAPFLRELEELLATLSHEELRRSVRAMGLAQPTDTRRVWLASVRAGAEPPRAPARDESLIADVEAFMARANRGDYAGDPSWSDIADALFARASRAYEAGHKDLVLATAGPLMRFFGDGKDACREALAEYESVLDAFVATDLTELKARYLRALYESLPADARAPRLLAETRALEFVGGSATLQVLLDADPSPLPDLESFLLSWEEALRAWEVDRTKHFDSHRRDSLLREVVQRREGLRGLHALAQSDATDRAEAYTELLRARHREGASKAELLAIAREALEAVTDGTERAGFADVVAGLAAATDDAVAEREARQTAFRAWPTVTRLFALAHPGTRGAREIFRAEAELYPKDPRGLDTIGALLFALAGQPLECAKALEEADTLGWSAPDHLGDLAFVATILYGLGDAPPAKTVVHHLWRSLDPAASGLWTPTPILEEAASARPSVADAIATSAREMVLTPSERHRLLTVAARVAERRLSMLGDQQRRRRYGHGAQLVVAAAEGLSLGGYEAEAAELIARVRAEHRYRPAVNRELNAAMAASSGAGVARVHPPARK